MQPSKLPVLNASAKKPPREHVVLLGGGLNLAASALEISDGECVQLDNYEINNQGDYQSLTGFERHDGRPAPSEAKALNGPYSSDEDELADLIIARESRRSAIQPVPGAGPVLGVFYFDDTTYAFRNNLAGDAAQLYKASDTGWQLVTTPVLKPSGYYRFRVLNFPDRDGKEIVGVDGQNPAFLFDGQTFTQINNTGMGADDKPLALEVLPSDILLLAYRGGSLQYSALGNPEDFDVANGAGEIRVVDEIQELDLQAKDSCAVFCRNRTYILYGRVESQFELTNLNTNTGAIANTIQTIGDSIYLDDRGLTRLSRVQSFGNFDMVTMSQKVNNLLDNYRSRIACSTVIREKNQYRLFFNDGSGLICTFRGADVVGYTTFELSGGRRAHCTCNAETNEGAEVVFFGGDDGYVYQLERGTSYDGDDIITVMRTAFSSFGGGQIGIRKRLTRATLEVKVVNDVTLEFSPDFDYSNPDTPAHRVSEVRTIGGGGYWDQATFNETYWSTALLYQASVYTRGTGMNVSGFCRTVSSVASPHVIASLVYRYIPLARRR